MRPLEEEISKEVVITLMYMRQVLFFLVKKEFVPNICQVSFPRNTRHPSGKRCLLSHSHPGIDPWADRLLTVLYH